MRICVLNKIADNRKTQEDPFDWENVFSEVEREEAKKTKVCFLEIHFLRKYRIVVKKPFDYVEF